MRIFCIPSGFCCPGHCPGTVNPWEVTVASPGSSLGLTAETWDLVTCSWFGQAMGSWPGLIHHHLPWPSSKKLPLSIAFYFSTQLSLWHLPVSIYLSIYPFLSGFPLVKLYISFKIIYLGGVLSCGKVCSYILFYLCLYFHLHLHTLPIPLLIHLPICIN